MSVVVVHDQVSWLERDVDFLLIEPGFVAEMHFELLPPSVTGRQPHAVRDANVPFLLLIELMFVNGIEEIGWCSGLAAKQQFEWGVAGRQAHGCAICVENGIDVLIPVVLVCVGDDGEGYV